MSTILERAIAHFEGQTRIEIDVPEWGAVLYSAPLTLAEKAKIFRKMGKQKDDLGALAVAVAMKAETEDGKKAFSMADVEDLKRSVDAGVLERIANDILGVADDDEDVEKN
jgi:hypothetical protein